MYILITCAVLLAIGLIVLVSEVLTKITDSRLVKMQAEKVHLNRIGNLVQNTEGVLQIYDESHPFWKERLQN